MANPRFPGSSAGIARAEIPPDPFVMKSFIDAVNRLADILSQPMLQPAVTLNPQFSVTPTIVPPGVEVHPPSVSVHPEINVDVPEIQIPAAPAAEVTVQPPIVAYPKSCKKTVHRGADQLIDYIIEEYTY